VLLANDDETQWLLDVDLLLQVIIQEHQFNIHMVYLSPIVCREGDEQEHRVQLNHRREDFIVVDAISLRVALHYKACLVLVHRPVLVPLHLEHPFHPDRLATGWEIDKALGVILLDGVHLFHHSLPLTGAVLDLGERGQLIRAHHVQFLSHQCTRREPGRHEDVAHVAEAKWGIITVVGIQVLIIDVIDHVCITGSSRES
jgi:hypothetical protein